jgi:acyl-CoA synthetase (AMP-forming)/AMP-acid ligase II
MCGGSPLAGAVEEELMKRLPSIQSISQGLGMTEACGALCISEQGLHFDGSRRKSNGSVGWPVNNTMIKVIDMHTSEMLPANEDGEICFKSPLVMLGYLNNPTATAVTIDTEGWLHTGDIGHYNDNGEIFVVDRLKELIKYNAYQVPPAELEAVLLSHPQVADAGVVGLPDAKVGELPRAYVVRKHNATVTEVQLNDFVSERVAPFKRLRGGVVFVKSIPRTASGKVLRKELRTLFSQPAKL